VKISELIQRYSVRPKKFLGQHFLSDYNIQKKMISAIEDEPSKTIIEIGPGLGILTLPLLEKGFKVIAIEKDRELCEILKQELSPRFKNFKLIHEDILNCDIKKIIARTKAVVVGNLPYNITTPILFHLINFRTSISVAYLTMQREVADRLTAHPGTKDYGRLTLSVRFFTEVDPLFAIHPNSFFPPPQVESSFVRFQFHPSLPPAIDPETYLKVVQVAFSKRRKQLGNVFSQESDWFKCKDEVKELFSQFQWSKATRAEELGIGDFVKLTEYLQKKVLKP
jgi:16S rRNA (adenine1518-N6/adenine1519-N6)-dimethyltransferase